MQQSAATEFRIPVSRNLSTLKQVSNKDHITDTAQTGMIIDIELL